MQEKNTHQVIATESISTMNINTLQGSQSQLNTAKHLNHESRPLQMIYPQFQHAYSQSIRPLNDETKLKIQNYTQNRQYLNYLYFTQTQSYIPLVNNQKIQLFQQQHNQLVTNYLIEALYQRQTNVSKDILNGILNFSLNNSKQKQQNPQQSQTQPQKHLTQQELKAYEEQIRKRHKQIIKQQQQQRKRIQKLKLKEQQQKIEYQKKLQQERKKQQQQMKRHQSQLISKKINELKERRQQQKKIYQQRNKDYNFILKSSLNNPALHQKMQINFRKRYELTFQEDRKKAKSERSKFLMNSRIQDLNIKDHEDKYLRWRSDSEAVRAAKMEEQTRLVEMYEKQIRRYKKYKGKNNNQKDNSDQEISDNQDSNDQPLTKQYKSYNQLRQQIHKKALQKRKKMQNYWQNFVKQDRQPQIDPKKQQELQNLIQSLQKSRKMKKVKNQKGEYVYEQLKISDPAMKGLQYLEYSRQLGRKRKQLKPKDSLQDSTTIHQQSQKHSTKIDYLKQLRESRSSSLNSSKTAKNKFAFLDKKDLTFHDKLQKVQRETFKLEQMTKLSQNQLKYGKFKTSQEILQYKEDIDNNHLEILKMKLMLAANGMN